MEQYISKSALVAEIEKWISGWTERLNNTNPSNPSFFEGGIEMGKHILSFINTLEVKEVDLELMLHEYWNLSSKITIDCLESATMTKDEMINFAKHFFELGLKVQKGE